MPHIQDTNALLDLYIYLSGTKETSLPGNPPKLEGDGSRSLVEVTSVGGLSQLHGWGNAADAHIRAFVIIRYYKSIAIWLPPLALPRLCEIRSCPATHDALSGCTARHTHSVVGCRAGYKTA